jgi:hypothetical protein
MNGTSDQPICPCGTITNPWVVFNQPGLPAISYRWGDYTSFRYALLQALPGETTLSQVVAGHLQQIWRPTADGDLALQVVEWWAYLADVLTFYCERIATQAYLGTADRPESTNRLIQLLGYRPRPALGAIGLVAALVDGPKPVILPQGLQIQSKSGPGQQPQIFELKSATTISSPDVLPATAPPPPAPVLSGAPDAQGRPLANVTIAGTVGALKAGDEILLIASGWSGTDGSWGVGLVQQVTPQLDPTGAPNTGVSVAVTNKGSALEQGFAADYRLLKSSGAATLFQFVSPSATIGVMRIAVNGANGGTHTKALSSITRQIVVGDPIVIEDPTPGASTEPLAAIVTGYSESIYYANNPSDPTEAPNGVTPIPIPVSVITFTTPSNLSISNPASILVRYGWKDLGTLIDPPLAVAGGTSPAAALELQYTPPSGFAASPGMPLLVQDANGDGAAAFVDSPTTINVPAPAPALTAPISALFNLLAVSRGKSVPLEVLGSGNAAILGQDFTLQNAPVTYLQDAASVSGDDYSSTVKVWVNGIQWQEVQSFYGLPADAQVFLTREDEQGKTHVVFNGRLPTGVNNVVASYRYGAGAQAPVPGSLTVILQPQPGLRAIVNPVAPGGGADADPPDKIRKLAPLSVMTFDRAVSLDDYRVIAGSAPGVARAAAEYAFDPASQRPVVTVWVGDDEGAVAAAQSAIAATGDPNRPPLVKLATQITMALSLTYLRDPRYQDATVLQALQTALVDPDIGLFGVNAVGIGQVFYASQIYAACLAIPGVQAIHDLRFAAPLRLSTFLPQRPVELGHGRRIPPSGPTPVLPGRAPNCTGERYDPGPGSYYAVPTGNLQLAGAVAP